VAETNIAIITVILMTIVVIFGLLAATDRSLDERTDA